MPSSRHPVTANEHRDRIIAAIQRRETPMRCGQASVGVIDFKKHLQAGWGAWFTASRATNAFEHCHALVLVGRPCISLTAGLSQFAVVHRHPPQQGALRAAYGAWYDRRRADETLQAIHRIRPAQKPAGAALSVYLLTDADCGGFGRFPVPLHAHQLGLDAGSHHHQLIHAALGILRASQPQQLAQRTLAAAIANQRGLKVNSVIVALKRALSGTGIDWQELQRDAADWHCWISHPLPGDGSSGSCP